MSNYRCVCPCSRCSLCWAGTEFCPRCACHGDIYERVRRGEAVKPIRYDGGGRDDFDDLDDSPRWIDR